MSSVIDSKMEQKYQDYARLILEKYSLDDLTVSYIEKIDSLSFQQDRRVVDIPIRLIETDAWSDIRFLFRAILDSPNSLWNSSADSNDWGGRNYYLSKQERS